MIFFKKSLFCTFRTKKTNVSLPRQIAGSGRRTKKVVMSKEKQEELIGRIGVFSEKSGYPPLVAKMIGLLLVSDPPQQTFEEIQTRLMSSKSAVSTGLNMLMDRGIVEYITFIGDRKRYFKVNTERWLALAQENLLNVAKNIGLFNDILQYRKAYTNDEKFTAGVEEVHDFHVFLAGEFPRLLDKWKASRQKF